MRVQTRAHRPWVGIARFVVFLAQPWLSPALAQEPKETDVLHLDEVLVTATRTSRSLREVPAHATVLTREQIRATAAQTVPDLLRSIPGFATRDYQSSVIAHPTRQAPALRGLGGTTASRVLVLVDGMPIDDPFGGWVHWARVPLEIVERVEIVRGGSSGIWGNRAMGGVINIITERAQESGGRASFATGGMSTRQGDVALLMRRGGLGIAVAGEYFDTDGYATVRNDLRGPIDTEAGTRHRMGFARLEYDISPRFTFGFTGSWLNEDRTNATPLRTAGTEIGSAQGYARFVTEGGSDWRLSLFSSVQSYYNVFSTEATDRSTEVLSLDQDDVPAKTLGANLQWSRSLGQHDITSGADVFWADGEANENYFYSNGAFQRRREVGGEQQLGGFYLQDVLQLGVRWRVQASGRLDLWRTFGGSRREHELRPDGLVFVDTTYESRSVATFNGGLGVRFEATPRLSLRGNVYSAFRAPTLNEQFKPFRSAANLLGEGNVALEPERLIGAEVGADYTFSDVVAGRMTMFWNRVSDAIFDVTVGTTGAQGRTIAPCGFVPAGGICIQRQNLGAFRAMGVETELRVQPHVNWFINATYTWNPTEVLDAAVAPILEGKSAPGAAEHQAAVQVAWRAPRLVDMAVTGRYVGERFDDDVNTLQLASFFVLDFRADHWFGESLNLFGTIENLLDEEYEVTRAANGLVRVGTPRLLKVGVRVRR